MPSIKRRITGAYKRMKKFFVRAFTLCHYDDNSSFLTRSDSFVWLDVPSERSIWQRATEHPVRPPPILEFPPPPQTPPQMIKSSSELNKIFEMLEFTRLLSVHLQDYEPSTVDLNLIEPINYHSVIDGNETAPNINLSFLASFMTNEDIIRAVLSLNIERQLKMDIFEELVKLILSDKGRPSLDEPSIHLDVATSMD